ncbi:septal ring lytic transglycosylase RlpA family protein [Bradyrhizobium sp. RDM12]
MVFRSSAAICGALIALAFSVTVARSETSGVHSSAVVDAAGGDAIVGAASTYNPFKPGKEEGGPRTASGERYDPSVWTAAIKTGLRRKFGGVQFGARPKFALVEAVGKKVIVKINDVGPLKPGRIIDLNERTMRHFDPSMELESFPTSQSGRCPAMIGLLGRSAERIATFCQHPSPSSSVQNPLLAFNATIGSPDVRGLHRKPRPSCRGFSFGSTYQRG